jgi:hypothetical protein
MVDFLVAQQTSTNTITQVKEFVNPLPKDKFVFIKILQFVNRNDVSSSPAPKVLNKDPYWLDFGADYEHNSNVWSVLVTPGYNDINERTICIIHYGIIVKGKTIYEEKRLKYWQCDGESCKIDEVKQLPKIFSPPIIEFTKVNKEFNIKGTIIIKPPFKKITIFSVEGNGKIKLGCDKKTISLIPAETFKKKNLEISCYFMNKKNVKYKNIYEKSPMASSWDRIGSGILQIINFLEVSNER